MKKLVVFASMLLAPAGVALAQAGQTATGLLITIRNLVDQATKIIVAIAILVFIWGVVKYVIAGDEEAKAKGRQMMIWGVIGLFAIVAVWGLVHFIANTTGVGPNVVAPRLPCPPGVPAC